MRQFLTCRIIDLATVVTEAEKAQEDSRQS